MFSWGVNLHGARHTYFPFIIIIIIINNLYSAKIQKFSGASHSMRNIIKNILINENKKINKLNKFKTYKSLGFFKKFQFSFVSQ